MFVILYGRLHMYNTRSFSLRTLSVVLSFCLLVVSLPLSAFANAGGNAAELEEDPVSSRAEIIEIE